MKLVLPIVILLACGTAVEAQQRVNTLPESVPVVAPAAVVAPAVQTVPILPVPAADAETVETDAAAATATIDAPAEHAVAAQSTPNNFWWLVGGIVLAGVILALLL